MFSNVGSWYEFIIYGNFKMLQPLIFTSNICCIKSDYKYVVEHLFGVYEFFSIKCRAGQYSYTHTYKKRK